MQSDFALRVEVELARARTLHPQPYPTSAVATGILLTQTAQLLSCLAQPQTNGTPLRFLHALASIAAVCQRTSEDLNLLPKPPTGKDPI
jgi:hypothetical protein